MAKKAKEAKKNLDYLGWIIPLIILVLVMIALVFIKFSINPFVIFSATNEKKYEYYQQICDKDDNYFGGVSNSVYGKINITYIIELKTISPFCKTSKKMKMSKEEFENLDCRCIEWNGKHICKEGYKLTSSEDGIYCYNEEQGVYTYSLIECSKYSCENSYVIEVS